MESKWKGNKNHRYLFLKAFILRITKHHILIVKNLMVFICHKFDIHLSQNWFLFVTKLIFICHKFDSHLSQIWFCHKFDIHLSTIWFPFVTSLKWKTSSMFRKELDRMDQEKEEAARMFRCENVRLNCSFFVTGLRRASKKCRENISKTYFTKCIRDEWKSAPLFFSSMKLTFFWLSDCMK
jgi:hypothetical protein